MSNDWNPLTLVSDIREILILGGLGLAGVWVYRNQWVFDWVKGALSMFVTPVDKQTTASSPGVGVPPQQQRVSSDAEPDSSGALTPRPLTNYYEKGNRIAKQIISSAGGPLAALMLMSDNDIIAGVRRNLDEIASSVRNASAGGYPVFFNGIRFIGSHTSQIMGGNPVVDGASLVFQAVSGGFEALYALCTARGQAMPSANTDYVFPDGYFSDANIVLLGKMENNEFIPLKKDPITVDAVKTVRQKTQAELDADRELQQFRIELLMKRNDAIIANELFGKMNPIQHVYMTADQCHMLTGGLVRNVLLSARGCIIPGQPICNDRTSVPVSYITSKSSAFGGSYTVCCIDKGHFRDTALNSYKYFT